MWSSFVPLGKGMEALRKFSRAFCGRGSPGCIKPPMVPLSRTKHPLSKGTKGSKPFRPLVRTTPHLTLLSAFVLVLVATFVESFIEDENEHDD